MGMVAIVRHEKSFGPVNMVGQLLAIPSPYKAFHAQPHEAARRKIKSYQPQIVTATGLAVYIQ